MDKFLITDEDIELFKINYSNSKIKIFRKMGVPLSSEALDNIRIEYKQKLYQLNRNITEYIITEVNDSELKKAYLLYKPIEENKLEELYREFKSLKANSGNEKKNCYLITELNMLFKSKRYNDRLIYPIFECEDGSLIDKDTEKYEQINFKQCKYLFNTSCKNLKTTIYDNIYEFNNTPKYKEANKTNNKFFIGEIVHLDDNGSNKIVKIKNIISNELNNGTTPPQYQYTYEVEIYQIENQGSIKPLEKKIYNQNKLFKYYKFIQHDKVKTIVPIDLKNYQYGVITMKHGNHGKINSYDVDFYVKDKKIKIKEVAEDKLDFYFNLSKGEIVTVLDSNGNIIRDSHGENIGKIVNIKFGDKNFSNNTYDILTEKNKKIITLTRMNRMNINLFQLVPLPKFKKNDNVRRIKVNKLADDKFNEGYLLSGKIENDWFDTPPELITFNSNDTDKSYYPTWLYSVKFKDLDYSKISPAPATLTTTDDIPENNLELYNIDTSHSGKIHLLEFDDGYYVKLKGYKKKEYEKLNNFICKKFSCLSKVSNLSEEDNVNEETQYRDVNIEMLDELNLDYNVEDYNFTRNNNSVCNNQVLHPRNVFKCSSSYTVTIQLINEYFDIDNEETEKDLMKRIIFYKGNINENFNNIELNFNKKNLIKFTTNNIDTIKNILTNLKHNTNIYNEKIFHVEVYNENGIKMADEYDRLEKKYESDISKIKYEQEKICKNIVDDFELELKELEIQKLELELRDLEDNEDLKSNIEKIQNRITDLNSKITNAKKKCKKMKESRLNSNESPTRSKNESSTGFKNGNPNENPNGISYKYEIKFNFKLKDNMSKEDIKKYIKEFAREHYENVEIMEDIKVRISQTSPTSPKEVNVTLTIKSKDKIIKEKLISKMEKYNNNTNNIENLHLIDINLHATRGRNGKGGRGSRGRNGGESRGRGRNGGESRGRGT